MHEHAYACLLRDLTIHAKTDPPNMSDLAASGVRIDAVWVSNGKPNRSEETALVALLRAIEGSGALAGAAAEAALSYRSAWGLLRRWERRLGQPLVIKERGRGTQLAPLGTRLLELDAEVRKRLQPHLREANERIASGLREVRQLRTPCLAISASDDPALSRLAELMPSAGCALEIETRGSFESLSWFSQGRCDMAGFHVPQGEVGRPIWERYRKFLKARRHVLIRFVSRTQGLMVKAGNPKRLRSIHDLSRRGVRFLNRQSGAGTRLLLDLMLRRTGIDPVAIAGYGDVQHTHSAVSAMIASGEADVGLGIESAARRFGLEFIPLLEEDYLLATHRERLDDAAVQTLLEILRGKKFRRMVASLPGYDPAASGDLIPVA